MMNPRVNRRWPVSLYWTLMLGLPAAGLLMAGGYFAIGMLIQYFLTRQ